MRYGSGKPCGRAAGSYGEVVNWDVEASLEHSGWAIESAEERHARSPETFEIPSLEERTSLRVGSGAKLLFWVLDRAGDQVAPQCERMWVVVESVEDEEYVGVLASSPASSDAAVRRGSHVRFQPEHVCDLEADQPGVGYLRELLAEGPF